MLYMHMRECEHAWFHWYRFWDRYNDLKDRYHQLYKSKDIKVGLHNHLATKMLQVNTEFEVRDWLTATIFVSNEVVWNLGSKIICKSWIEINYYQLCKSTYQHADALNGNQYNLIELFYTKYKNTEVHHQCWRNQRGQQRHKAFGIRFSYMHT